MTDDPEDKKLADLNKEKVIVDAESSRHTAGKKSGLAAGRRADPKLERRADLQVVRG